MKPIASKKETKVLSLRHLYFLSVGGQGPFISLISFGTEMLILAGIHAVVSMIIATVIVLINGFVINFLARRFTRGGGYYIYGLYGLTERLGFETGWMYIFYGLSYGGALILGGAYTFKLITGFNDFISLLIILAISSVVFLSGVRISAKYAEVFAGSEIAVLILLSIYIFYLSGFKIYNPFSIKDFNLQNIWLGALYGLGIPTGYGVITPLAEESKMAKRDIGIAAILSILTGGLIASFFFYALAAISFTGNLAQFLVSKFGIIADILIGLVALSDGILGGIAFLLAVSRVIYNVSKDGFISHAFSRIWKNRPIISEVSASVGMFLLLVPLTYWMGVAFALGIIGALAGIFNLFVHESANFSLLRISLVKRNLKRALETLVSFLGILISGYLLIVSLIGVSKYVILAFFGWMILGFFYLETLDIIRKTSKE